MQRQNRRVAGAVMLVMLAGFCFRSGWSEEARSEWKAPRNESEKKNPLPSDQKSIAAGQAVYAKNCATCHGKAGKGDGPKGRDLQPRPSDLTSQQVVGQSDGSLFWKTTAGRRPMPTFRKLLSDEDRWNVINYLRTLGPTKQPDQHQ